MSGLPADRFANHGSVWKLERIVKLVPGVCLTSYPKMAVGDKPQLLVEPLVWEANPDRSPAAESASRSDGGQEVGVTSHQYGSLACVSHEQFDEVDRNGYVRFLLFVAGGFPLARGAPTRLPFEAAHDHIDGRGLKCGDIGSVACDYSGLGRTQERRVR